MPTTTLRGGYAGELPWMLATLALLGQACTGGGVDRPPPPAHTGVHGFANACFTMDATTPGSDDTRWLVATEDGESFEFAARVADDGSRLFLRPSDLGTYLLYDAEGHYLVAEAGLLSRVDELTSDVLLIDDSYESPAEWLVEPSAHDADRFQLRHRQSGQYLTPSGLAEDVDSAGVVAFYPAEGCAEFPELSVDAVGEVVPRMFDDGSVYGVVDVHSHIMSNFGFGGGGVFHGAPFHRLGVEHALPDCAPFHGGGGRRDVMGFGYDQGSSISNEVLLSTFFTGRTPGHNHETAGYPDFTDWPNAPSSATHQNQYYRWIERAWLGGLRLVVQHATSSSVMCELLTGGGVQSARYSCNDMVAVDRSIDETYAMERYIDAQEGGPGLGWFRIVTSPEQAREVIGQGKLAVMLGIETSNLFDCFVTPPEGFERCTPEFVTEQLDRYHELGVRVLFPVHKFDNAFSAGDGQRAIIEAGNFINTGHWSSFTEDCDPSIPSNFDRGGLTFGGLNMPRDDYFAPPAVDFSGFADDPIGLLGPYLDAFMAGPLEGEFCQSHGLTSLGEHLISEMMSRGMILEVDHFPDRSFARAYEILEANDYPAAGTHGQHYGGRLFALGGISQSGLGRCHDPDRPGSTVDRLTERVELIASLGGYPAAGFGFDLNGFAGARGPRFGEGACSTPQTNPVTYPFASYAGDVMFEQPQLGNRTVDFNTEGMVHIGLLPELIEDSRRDGATDEQLEPLFRSAEAYLRMWERAESRSLSLR